MAKAGIHIDLDKRCTECGRKGAAQNGFCLACVSKQITKNIERRGMEVKVTILNIEDLKTAMAVKKEVDKDTGEVTSCRLMTKITIEAEVDPRSLAEVHRMLATETPVGLIISSSQTVMDLKDQEGVLAGR